MTSLMHLSQHSDRLVLAYPAWVGIAFIVAAVVLVVCVVFGGQRTRRRSLFGVASVVAAWAGLYFATFNATITHETGSVSAFMHDQRAMQWKDAKDLYLERRGSERDSRIIVLDARGQPFEIGVGDLSIADRDRLMAYIVDHVPDSAFPRSPSLLKRHAPNGTRRVGVFSDQQT